MNELFKEMIEKGYIEFQKTTLDKLDYVGKILIFDLKTLAQNKN